MQSTQANKIQQYANLLAPLTPEFDGEGPNLEACDAAREQAVSRLGNIDAKMLVGETVATEFKREVEVSGWRPWHNPGQMHNLNKHSPDDRNRILDESEKFSQTGLYPEAVLPAAEKEVMRAAAAARSAVNELIPKPPKR